jgi:hypothetical protein
LQLGRAFSRFLFFQVIQRHPVESAATAGDDESLADEKLGQQTGRKQQEWWLGLGILVNIGEGRQGQVWQEWWRRKAGLPLYRARERGRGWTVPEELWPWRAKERKQASC